MNKINVFDILRRRYPAGEYALMEEVRDKAGFSASRSADFIIMNLWPSRGLYLSGLELKSFRSDWLSELKKPEKAENIFQYCDFFWLLTESEDVAKIEEVPANWGWMTIKGSKIHIKKEAPKLEPKHISRNFLAAMLKRSSDKSHYVRLDAIEDRINQAKEYVRGEEALRLNRTQKELAEIKQHVSDFKKTSGIDIDGHYRWQTSPTKMGEMVKFLESGGVDQVRKDLIQLESRAQDIVNSITHKIKLLKEENKVTI